MESTQSYEAVNGPPHYNGTEVIDKMVVDYDPVAVCWFSLLNSTKYRARMGKKPGQSAVTDLKKAKWYEGYARRLTPPANTTGLFSRLRLCWHVLTGQDSPQVNAFVQRAAWGQIEQVLANPARP
jgi:hypothetical protein